MRYALSLLAALPLLFGEVSPARGQVVVTVSEEETGEPVVGAVVYLMAATGGTEERTMTNDRGMALLTGFGGGQYRLRVEMIGMATVETNLFHAAQGSTLQREVRLERKALVLEGLDIDVEGRCRVRPEGMITAQVWEEARKALEGSTTTAAGELYRYRTMLYERDLELETKRILSEKTSIRSGTMRTPFLSRSAEELAEKGYVEESGKVTLYFAPDARVLLSDLFLDSHCFRLRVDPASAEHDRLIGLAFEPLELEGRRVDVSGTLWLDRETSELEWLEFHYENLDPELRSSEIGGRVEFRRMADGAWIVPKWWIRMPNVAVQTNVLGGRPRQYVASLRETGGVVLEAERTDAADGVRVDRRPVTSRIAGVVKDSAGSAAKDVELELVGTGRSAVTDSAGRFSFADLVEGIYEVRIREPLLEALGWVPKTATLNVFAGYDLSLDLDLPSVRQVVGDACSVHVNDVGMDNAPPQAAGKGILFGRVVNAATGEPLQRVHVRVHSYRHEFSSTRVDPTESQVGIHRQAYGIEVVTDEAGFYRLCGVPEGELLDLTVLRGDEESDGGTVRITEPGGVVRRDIEVPPSR